MQSNEKQNQTDNEADIKPLGFLSLLQSTLWAALGVQKSENHKRDFTRGNAYHFIYMGVGFTILFVMTLIGIVHAVLSLLEA